MSRQSGGQLLDHQDIKVGCHANSYAWHLCQLSSKILRYHPFVGKSANMDKQHLLRSIKDELKRQGLTAAEASERAVGNKTLIANMGRDRYGMPSTEHLQALCNVLKWEFYIGPPREAGPVEQLTLDDGEFAQIPLHDALLAAGTGAENAQEEVVDQLAFRRDWLKRMGVVASNARLARVHGDSMQPTIWAGDMILIDTKRIIPQIRTRDARDQRRAPVYAMIDNGEARVKRIERPAPDTMFLTSDNSDYPPELRQGDDMRSIQIIGKVVWWSHVSKE